MRPSLESPEGAMSIEIAGMLVALTGTLIGCIVTFKKEGKGHRLAPVLTSVFALITLFLALEQYERTKELAEVAADLDRKWTVLQDANAGAIEFEVMSPDGSFHLSDMLENAKRIRFRIDGVDLPIGPAHADGILLSDALNIDQLTHAGRIGIASFQVKISPQDRHKIEEVKGVDCTASRFITREFLSRQSAQHPVDDTCSAAVTLPLSGKAVHLAAVFNSPRVVLTMTEPTKLPCLGICREGPVISVRLLVLDNDLFPTAIEVSPFLYLTEPSQFLDQEKRISFELSGGSIASLAKSHFLQSYGYQNQEHFPLTHGALFWLLKRFTHREEVLPIFDVVWTTNPSPDLQSLIEAVDPAKRSSSEPMHGPEWCGFGNRKFCWYRFAIFGAQK